MCAFDNCGPPEHFDNYFNKIASVYNYQIGLASSQKYHLPRMKTSLDQFS